MDEPAETGPVFGRVTLSVPMTIRLCTAADLPALEWMGLYSPHRAVIRDAFAAQQRGDGLMLLGVAGGFPVGQVWIDLAARRAERTAVLWAVRSFHPLHGTGIGGHLMAAAERLLRERGVRRAELGVERGNEAARRFYERRGWRAEHPFRETVRFTTPDGAPVEQTLDLIRMAKDLNRGE